MGNMFKCALKQGGSGGSGADLIVTCSAEFAGATITASKTGSTSQTQTCPSTSPYVVTFSGLDNGTWTVSGTISGQTYSVQATITDFSAILNPGFNWQAWVDSAQYLDSSDYNDLDEVLEDEEALRELFLEHNCVDYLADVSTASADVTKILNTDLAAKWINNSDYALDILSANAEIKTVMDTADKYGYGERCLMPQVPTMTSNTAPYGEASASSEAGSQAAYRAFDGIGSDWWSSNNTAVDQYITYDFVEAIEVKKLALSGRRATNSVDQSPKDFRLLGSNDNWNTSTELGSYTYDGNSNIDALGIQEFDVTNTNTYKSLRIAIDTVHPSNNNVISINSIQFYAWAPKGNVPVMTANTAPYGEAFGSSMADSGTPYYAPFAGYLDEGGSHVWSSQNNKVAGEYVGYKFTNPTCVKSFELNKRVISYTNTSIKDFKLQASNDGTTYVDLGTYEKNTTDASQRFTVDNDNYYLYYRIYVLTNRGGSNVSTPRLQFYGRQLSVSVPVMTSNTLPYGEASASGANSGYEAYKAFDGNSSSYWVTNSASAWIQYHFTSKMCPKMLDIQCGSGNRIASYSLKGSNDGSDFTNEITNGTNSTTGAVRIIKEFLSNLDEYEYLRLEITSNESASGEINQMQFYGLDYSEKEFEQGSTKKWLYDHGVELVNLSITGNAQKEDSQLYVKGVNALADIYTANMIDLSPYNLLRAKGGNRFSGTYSNICGDLKVTRSNPSQNNMVNIASFTFTTPLSSPNNISIDVSAITQEAYIVEAADTTSYTYENSLTELWLE